MIKQILNQKRTRIMKNIIPIGQAMIILAKNQKRKIAKSLENI
jgi:hypothetical protein